MLEREELRFCDGRSPLLCVFDTTAFRVVEGEEYAQVVLEEEIDGRRDGRVCQECVCLLDGLEIICLQVLMLSEIRERNRCHVALREIDNDKDSSL